jgi:hypothetical protein
MMEQMNLWNALKTVPASAVKIIKGGRLKGMSDIKPQWRYETLTKQFGPCGVGWKFEIVKQWSEAGADGELMCFTNINFYYHDSDGWSDAIPGTGGSMLISSEKNGMHSSDEGYKMSLTDAIGVAVKMIGVAADVYMGNPPETKYAERQTSDRETILCPQTDMNGERSVF